MGRTEIEDALGLLDRLTQHEALMAAIQNLKSVHDIGGILDGVNQGARELCPTYHPHRPECFILLDVEEINQQIHKQNRS